MDQELESLQNELTRTKERVKELNELSSRFKAEESAREVDNLGVIRKLETEKCNKMLFAQHLEHLIVQEKANPSIPVALVVDFFKETGKWVATAEILTTDKKIQELKAADEYGYNAICDFIRQNQGELKSTDPYYWAVSTKCVHPEDEEFMHEFCRFLVKP